jgi:hypothetical protein
MHRKYRLFGCGGNDPQNCSVEYARVMEEPALRASDDDRDVVLQALERHLAAGRLDLDEFDQRSTAALTAVTLDQLATLTTDLPSLTTAPVRSLEPAYASRHLVLIFVIAFATLAVLLAMMLLHP